MVVRDAPGDPWKVIGRPTDEQSAVDIGVRGDSTDTAVTGEKRPRGDSLEDGQETKRVRTSPLELDKEGHSNSVDGNSSSSPCLAPTLNAKAQGILSALDDGACASEQSLGTGDIFLTQGWRERWCRCNRVCSITSRTGTTR
jgi:E3 ubiquitin-protein ligase UBR7